MQKSSAPVPQAKESNEYTDVPVQPRAENVIQGYAVSDGSCHVGHGGAPQVGVVVANEGFQPKPQKTGVIATVTRALNSAAHSVCTAISDAHKSINSHYAQTRDMVSPTPLYINDTDGQMYLVMDNTFRHIPDTSIFHALFNRPLNVRSYDLGHFDTAPGNGKVAPPYHFGEPIPSFARIVVCNGEHFFIDSVNGSPVRRQLLHGAWTKHGFAQGTNVVAISEAELLALPVGFALKGGLGDMGQ